MNPILERKKSVIQLLKDIEGYPAISVFKQDMMAFAYVVVCGAIEFMTETIIQDWLNKTIKHHKGLSYRGRKYVQYFLDTQSRAREKNIENFHSTDLDKIRELIKNIVGETARDKFNQLFQNTQQTLTLQPDINERLKRITRIRHELAHGQKMPNDLQPNIPELKEDFLFIYEHIIKNIKKCLPRV